MNIYRIDFTNQNHNMSKCCELVPSRHLPSTILLSRDTETMTITRHQQLGFLVEDKTRKQRDTQTIFLLWDQEVDIAGSHVVLTEILIM